VHRSRGNDGVSRARLHPEGAIEYGYVAPDPLDPDVIYGAGRNDLQSMVDRQVQRNTDSVRGPEFCRSHGAAYFRSTRTPLYYGANRLVQDERRGSDVRRSAPTSAAPGAIPASRAALHLPERSPARCHLRAGSLAAQHRHIVGGHR